MVIGEKANLPTFSPFIGILGGLQAYGILGTLFGPLIVTLVITFTEIYRGEFAGRNSVSRLDADSIHGNQDQSPRPSRIELPRS